MQELDSCRKLTLCKPKGIQHVGKPKLSWLESVEKDLKNMGMRAWRRKSQDREEWMMILEEAKVHRELQFQKKNKNFLFVFLVYSLVTATPK
jgi:hypothetical protein